MAKGKHLLVDCYNVPEAVCLNDALMMKTIAQSAEEAGATVLSQVRYRLGHNSPPGFAVVIMLDESHCSAHSYADQGLIAMDLFTCGTTDPSDVFEIIKNKLNLGNVIVRKFDRFLDDLD